MKRKVISVVLAISVTLAMTGCASGSGQSSDTENSTAAAEESASASADKAAIEEALNLANNAEQTWTYSADSDAWVLSIVSAVANPEIPDEQGVSVCVPGAYVKGIDTDGDGQEDVLASDSTSSEGVSGSLVIDYDAEITSSNGQVYTAATAPVIVNTGAAGYASSTNTLATTTYASEGYINVACGNRGKQDTVTDENGNTEYTGDAPSCLVDQKNAIRYVKYNILLGNLPGSVDYFVSTGGSGGGAHATMVASTGNNPDYYDYEIEAGAVGVYKTEDGYSTTVTIDGTDYEISDGVWGCLAYSAITSLAEADMAMAFEYYMDTDYEFNTDFQAQMAEYLSAEYMEYINDQNLSVEESAVGFDLNEDGDEDDTVALTIEYDETKYADTNGYGGTYLTLYLDEFESNLQNYLDNLDYAEGWTWFDEDGNALSDEEVAAMTSADKAEAFIEGRYAKSTSAGNGPTGGMPTGMDGNGPTGSLPDGTAPAGMDGTAPADAGSLPDGTAPAGMDGTAPTGTLPDGSAPIGMDGTAPDGTAPTGMDGTAPSDAGTLPDGTAPTGMDGTAPTGTLPDGTAPSDAGSFPDGTAPTGTDGTAPTGMDGTAPSDTASNSQVAENSTGDQMKVGTPDAGTTQGTGSSTDSSNYSSFEEMLESYQSDIESIEAGDEYGNNIVELYNPLNYIGADDTEDAAWVRIVCGAAEGDISMFNSLNLQIAMLNAGTDCQIEWQWDGGHVPSEILGDSFSLYVDEMYGKYVDGAVSISKASAGAVTANGDAEEATGTNLSSWVDYSDISNVSFSLADAVSYRTKGASKATPGFDVMDYGQEDYVFGNSESDARHWDQYVLKVLEEHSDQLSALWNESR